MKRAITLLIIIFFSSFSAVGFAKERWDHWALRPPLKVKTYIPCEGYKVEGPELISFNKNEIKLICGDPDVVAWKKIPVTQAKYNIRNFLQARGYYFPKFKRDGKEVVVDIGQKTHIKEVEITGDYPDKLRVNRRRHTKGATLTPSTLSSVGTWTEEQLNNMGYPCSDVLSSADAVTGEVTLKVNSGPKRNFPEIIEDPVKEFDPAILRRYDAFAVGKPYKSRLLTLTSRRIERDGIAQSSYFVPQCKNGQLEIAQKSVTGKPRLFIFGVGADTEEIVKGKISWKHSRLGRMGSSVKVSAMASYRIQRFNTNAKWYILPKPSRWYLMPNVTFVRRYERLYDYISFDAGIFPASTWDGDEVRINYSFGPELSYKRTYKGADPGFTHFVSADFAVEVISHDYEYYDFDPRNGYQVAFTANLNSKDMLSSLTVQQLQVAGEWLWNIGQLDPPLFIFSVRGGIGTSIIDRSSLHFARLPPAYLYYLGGSQTLRGFKRQELPRTYSALSMVFASFEGRVTGILPLDFQPIAFVDIGALGQASANLDFPVYWSPGFGVRWPSFAGVFRFTVGHGFMINNKQPANNTLKHWQFFFSYGEEF